MTTAWSPGVRDSAADGLAKLIVRPVWGTSEAGPSIRDALTELLGDQSPLVRRAAASGIGGLYADLNPVARISAIGDIALAENDHRVIDILLWWLTRHVAQAPAEVDGLLRALDARESAATDDSEIAMSLLAYLATVPRTPFASERLAGWFDDAITQHKTVGQVVPHLRDYLNLPDGRGQQAAFKLVGVAASAARDQWHSIQAYDEADRQALIDASARIAHAISQQIYFASGAFDDLSTATPQPRGDLRQFATYALPVLQSCAEVEFPASTQEVVQTLIYLAPVSERQMLLAIARAVPQRGPYATDSLAASAVLPYLHRLLVEQRDLVLRDANGLTAFRHLLQTFAAAGNEEALALAYNFADVFR
jgi:hypothetical protein